MPNPESGLFFIAWTQIDRTLCVIRFRAIIICFKMQQNLEEKCQGKQAFITKLS